jgi:hypothetical protein
MIVPCQAEDAVFRLSNIFIVSDNQETKVTLTLSDANITIQGKQAGGVNEQIPYSSITKMSYEGVRHHHLSQAFAPPTVLMGIGLPLIVAATKGEDHWLAVDHGEGRTVSTTILRLDKKEYQAATSALAAKTGKPVDLLDTKTESLDPTVASKDIYEAVPFPSERVAAALKQAMGRFGCRVQKESSSSIQCKRRLGNSTLTGPGGETVIASIEAQGAGTHIRIVSKKVVVRNRNWSTPVYQDMMRELGAPQ